MRYVGIDMMTGQEISDLEHIRASIRDILLTPIGSRVMRRDYGSRLFQLVDDNINGLTLARIYAATADALRKWEPRIRLTRVQVDQSAIDEGRIVLQLWGIYLLNGREVRIDGVDVPRRTAA